MALLGLVQVKVSVQVGQVGVGLQKDYYKIQATTFSIALTLKLMSTQWSIFICGLQKCFHSSLHDFLKYACQIDLSVASTRGSRFMDKTQLRIRNQTSLRICASFERCAMFLVCQDKSALLKKTHLLSLTLFISKDIHLHPVQLPCPTASSLTSSCSRLSICLNIAAPSFGHSAQSYCWTWLAPDLPTLSAHQHPAAFTFVSLQVRQCGLSPRLVPSVC